MQRFLYFLLVLFVLVTTGCEAQSPPELVNALMGKDPQGPLLIEGKATEERKVTFTFDKLIFAEKAAFKVAQVGNAIESLLPLDNTLILTLEQALRPGERTLIEGRVRDASGNTLSFQSNIWGYNAHLPRLLLNEFTTKGSGNNPDRVELLALSDGNLAGLTLYDGVADECDSAVILPPFNVIEGDYIVVQYTQELSGKHPIEFYGGEVGLGSNNGLITLYDSPGGSLLDVVVYSNRTSDSDTNYAGWGTSKVFKRVKALESSGKWLPLPLKPEGAVKSADSTATRSFCRWEKQDTDTKDDWYIVPTGKASFGSPNTTEIYNP
ncbi:MAG: hypothetical protein WC224_05375 [Sphaerochaetaceae bacterium]